MEIKSYVPEREVLKNKDSAGMRICYEDCAVVDPSRDFQVVAYRGTGEQAEKTLTDVYNIPHREMEFLQRALLTHRRILLCGKDRPILVFGDQLRETGLLLAVAPECTTESAARVLFHTSRSVFAISPKLAQQNTGALRTEDEKTYGRLQNIFYYLDRLTSSSAELGVWTRALLAANFAGCALSAVDLPVKELPISNTDRARLTVFFLCVFLALRTRDGDISTTARSTDSPIQSYRVCVELLQKPRKKSSAPQRFPFLESAAFRGFSLTSEYGKTVLEVLFDISAEDCLRASLPELLGFCMILESFFSKKM